MVAPMNGTPKFDLSSSSTAIRYKGRDGYSYYSELLALQTFGIDEPGTAQWDLGGDALFPVYVFASFTPSAMESPHTAIQKESP